MIDEKRSKDTVKTSKLKFRIISIIITLAFLSISIFITITFISGRGFNFDWLKNLFNSDVQVDIAEDLYFNIGRARQFADLEDSVAAAGSLGVQVINYDGTETLRESVNFSTPAIVSRGGYAIALDIGGSEARVFSSKELIAKITKNGPIVSASININGWATVDAQEGEGYRGNTTVYDNNGVEVYRVSLSSGYILSSAISPDNDILAILSLTDYGSRVTFYRDLGKEEYSGEFKLLDNLILSIEFLENNDLLAITTSSVFLIDPINTTGWEIYNFEDMSLGGYEVKGNFIALHLLDFGIGHLGKLVMLDIFGNLYGETKIDRELISMSLLEDKLSVMLSDGLIFLDRSLNHLPAVQNSPSAVGVSRILALSNSTTLVAGDRFAIVVK